MSMIERVARAIALSVLRDEGAWMDWVSEARASIEALREPTDAMVSAADNAMNSHPVLGPERAGTIRTGYSAMIDAALNEQVTG